MWNFGDNSYITSQGYNQSRMQQHAYGWPGVYHVVVVAHNTAGQSEARTDVTVISEY